jgi:hypothetical protein
MSLFVAACGSGSSSTSSGPTTTRTTQTTAANAASPPATATSGSAGTVAAVTTGPVRAALRGADHAPVVKRAWAYSIVATDASGHPLTGTVEVQFVYGGQVVGRDRPPTHQLTNGRWHDNLRFPSAALGIPLTFQTVVRTPAGTATLNWPVKVRQ